MTRLASARVPVFLSEWVRLPVVTLLLGIWCAVVPAECLAQMPFHAMGKVCKPNGNELRTNDSFGKGFSGSFVASSARGRANCAYYDIPRQPAWLVKVNLTISKEPRAANGQCVVLICFLAHTPAEAAPWEQTRHGSPFCLYYRSDGKAFELVSSVCGEETVIGKADSIYATIPLIVQCQDGDLRVSIGQQSVSMPEKGKMGRPQALTVGAPAWGPFAEKKMRFTVAEATDQLSPPIGMPAGADSPRVGRGIYIIGVVLRIMLVMLLASLVYGGIWLFRRLVSLKVSIYNVAKYSRRTKRVIYEVIESEFIPKVVEEVEKRVTALRDRVDGLGVQVDRSTKEISTNSVGQYNSRSKHIEELPGKFGSMDKKVNDLIQQTDIYTHKIANLETEVAQFMDLLEELSRRIPTDITHPPGQPEYLPSSTDRQTDKDAAQHRSMLDTLQPDATPIAQPKPFVQQNPVETWKVCRTSLEDALTLDSDAGIRRDISALDRYYQVLVVEWAQKLSPQQDPPAWEDEGWLSRLDEALYSTPNLTGQRSSSIETEQSLLGIREAIEKIRVERFSQLAAWNVERIEGLEGIDVMQPRVLERDDSNGPQQTQDRRKDETYCRIVPGRGGYRINGNVVKETYAVFYRYQET